MKKIPIFILIILFALLISSCKYDFILPEAVPIITTPPTFALEVAPIFSNGNKCTSCHSGGQAPDLRAANAYAQLVPKYVNTVTPASSDVYINARPGSAHFAQVTAAQAAIILAWIADGAKNN